jgi:hypothetical protein
MDANKTFVNVAFPFLVLFGLALGFTAPGPIGCLLALIPATVCLVETLDFTAALEPADDVGDWSDLLAELVEPRTVRVAYPVWSGWTSVVAGVAVARGADPVVLFDVTWTTKSGRKSRKRVAQPQVTDEFVRLARGGYTNVRVARAA